MTHTPFRLSDIGLKFPWTDLRDFIENLPPTGESALYRAQFPRSWWWTPDHDFASAVLSTLRWGNWQRGGGKGPKPEPVKKPKEKRKPRVKADPVSADELAEKRRKLKALMEGGCVDG